MLKFKVLITIKSQNTDIKYETEATYNEKNNYLYYFETDEDKTFAIYDFTKNILKRDNLKMYQELQFLKNNITINQINLKDLNRSLEIEIFTSNIISDKPNITVNYLLNAEKYLYKIEVLEELKCVS